MGKRTGLAIVNRSFWPQNQVIGEGLLQFAETVVQSQPVSIITQSSNDLADALKSDGRGQGIKCYDCRARTTSASSLPWRMIEALAFMCWVLWSLIRARPAKVYVSTDPPVVVPFIVAIYCRLFRVEFVYHLQDIHPEAANIVLPLNPMVFRALRWMDNIALRSATRVVTLSSTMKTFLLTRSGTSAPVDILDNPAVDLPNNLSRGRDIIYCGNAGRLQRIPLVISAIRAYADQGGTLQFTFAGGGVYAPELKQLAQECLLVDYQGVLSASQAASLVSQHRWGLLPINDEVTNYAFPSKSSTYALSGARIIAVCGEDTSVAQWVYAHAAGIVCMPEVDALVACFKSLEQVTEEPFVLSSEYSKKLALDYFSRQLANVVKI